MTQRPDPTPPATPDAIAMARDLLAQARHAALAVIDAQTGAPGISRIALGLTPVGLPITLISSLAVHTAALLAHPQAALMVGEPGAKGDPLTHPRLMLNVTAQFVSRDSPTHETLRAHYLETHPKAKLYVDFADFTFVVFIPSGGLLNGGFGRAFRIAPADLALS